MLIRIRSTDGTPLIGFDEDQQPLPGNLLRAYASRRAPGSRLDPNMLAWQATSDCGRFTGRWSLLRDRSDIGADCLGEVELFGPPPLCVSLVSGDAVVATRELTEVPGEILFTLDPNAIRAPLAGLRVRLLQSDSKTPAAHGSRCCSPTPASRPTPMPRAVPSCATGCLGATS
ncbi:MAG: hypothetical protein IPJ19_21630 [Planctomycetes bacterium]|nr:hypothetical protein [Planctomycetota bacterium]